MLQFCTLPEAAGFRPRRAVPAAHIRSCGGPRLRTLGSSCLALLLQGQGSVGASQGRAEDSTIVNLLAVFRRSSKFSEVQAVCRSLGESPLVGLFQAGYAELTAQLRQSTTADTAETQVANPKSGPGRPTLKSLTAVDRALMRASVVEVNKLEHRIPFLATTASIAPFIGLFGTVWGIIMAFEGIGQTGSSSLAVVAPGIAEALIATAAGLGAAIPAVWFY